MWYVRFEVMKIYSYNIKLYVKKILYSDINTVSLLF